MHISHQVNATHIYHISNESYFHLIKVINSPLKHVILQFGQLHKEKQMTAQSR